MSIYEQGETYTNRVTVKNEDSQVTTPSSIVQYIYSPCEHSLVTGLAMTNTGGQTGKYHYHYTIDSSATFGRYRSVVEATTSTTTVRFTDEYFVLPWDALRDVRQTMGLSETKSIDDKDLANVIWNCYTFALRDVYVHHHDEEPDGNPDTGLWFDGSNTSFQTKHYPIADVTGDGTVTGTTSCATDIGFRWLDTSGHNNVGSVVVVNAENGEITLTQSSGAAIPQDHEGVFLDYWVEHENFDNFQFQQAVVRLACHEISKRFAGLDRVTLADIRNNSPLITIDPDMYWNDYRRYINPIRAPLVTTL